MITSPPKVSVIMSVYNGSRYVREALDSILNQSFTDFEFIIIDDSSTDASWNILTDDADKDRRIRLFKNEANIGLTRSLNKGLNLAQGEYIARQDADDVSLPERFAKQVEVLDNYAEVMLVSCDMQVINAEGLPLEKMERACDPDLLPWYLLFHNRLAGHSQVMFRREPVITLGGYADSIRYCQDYELWCRLIKVGKMVILPEVLLKYRCHNGNISSEKALEQASYYLAQIRKNFQEFTGESITLQEATNLSQFWIGTHHWWPDFFPDSRTVDQLHSRLEQSYSLFLQQCMLQNGSHPEMAQRLRAIIGQQFLYWIQSPLNGHHGVQAKLRVSLYALAWCPSGVPGSWFSVLWKSRSYLWSTLIRLCRKNILRTDP